MNFVKVSVKFAVVLLGSVLVLAGCASTKKRTEPPTIMLTEFGSVCLDGRMVPMAQLTGRLKKMGIKPQSGLSIQISPNASKSSMQTLSSALISGGYPRFVFTAPIKATVEVKK